MQDLGLETFKAIDEVRREVRSIQDDVSRIKMALVGHLPDEDTRETVVQIGLYETEEAFEEFCKKLEDGAYRKLVVCITFCGKMLNPANI